MTEDGDKSVENNIEEVKMDTLAVPDANQLDSSDGESEGEG